MGESLFSAAGVWGIVSVAISTDILPTPVLGVLTLRIVGAILGAIAAIAPSIANILFWDITRDRVQIGKMSTIHDPRYIQLIAALVNARIERSITQVTLAKKLGQHQSYVAKVEGLERRLDVIELFDWLQGLDYKPHEFFEDIGWFPKGCI